MSWRESADDGDDHDLGLNLSLQLKCPSQKQPQHKPSLNGISFGSSSAPRSSTRLDLNMLSSSSPDNTITSGNGKTCEREETGLELLCANSEGVAGDESATKKKLKLTKEQTKLLKEAFKHQNTLNQSEKVTLANHLNLQTRQVEVWFQNQRARTKSKKTEADCAYLKRDCENLMEENLRLQKEVDELKAPTTLSTCPQCERIWSVGSDNAQG